MKNEKAGLPVSPLHLSTIGILYSTSDSTAVGREIEKCADYEVIHEARAIQTVLTQRGFQVEVVDLNPERFTDLQNFDFLFNLAETIYGFPLADYEVAERLEALNINFTGSGSTSLRACLDKANTKTQLLKYGILTPAFELYNPGEPVHTDLKFPLIVKPVHEDGSFGITRNSVVWNETDLQKQVLNTHKLYLQAALVEEFIEGKDITASILGNGSEALCLPLAEIFYPEEHDAKFLTFEANWIEQSLDFQSTQARCPSQLETEVTEQISQIALQAFNLMECRDYARVDFRLRGKEVFVLEVNPNPCLDREDSGFVRCGNAQGFSYEDLIYQILAVSYKNRSLD